MKAVKYIISPVKTANLAMPGMGRAHEGKIK
jgi:hypothetical protein